MINSVRVSQTEMVKEEPANWDLTERKVNFEKLKLKTVLKFKASSKTFSAP